MPMPDGVVLLTTHYYPRAGGKLPTILLRTPYGRANFDYIARFFAERGFQVVLQACRGTDGSQGEFDAFRQEHIDAKPTKEKGTFGYLDRALTTPELNSLMQGGEYGTSA